MPMTARTEVRTLRHFFLDQFHADFLFLAFADDGQRIFVADLELFHQSLQFARAVDLFAVQFGDHIFRLQLLKTPCALVIELPPQQLRPAALDDKESLLEYHRVALSGVH